MARFRRSGGSPSATAMVGSALAITVAFIVCMSIADPMIAAGSAITYRELQQHVAACRDRLYAAGVRVGDRVSIFSRNSADYIYAYMAIASLGAIAPFLTRAVFDDALIPVRADGAIGSPDLERLYWLVAGLIAIPLVSALIGVGQTYLTNRIGNSAMADLRVALFEHLEKMELAFFTSTKTGDIQTSRSGPAPSRPGSTTRWSSPTAACWRTGSDRRRPM